MKAFLALAIGIYITAWFAIVQGDYVYALLYAFVAFALWLLTLDTIELMKNW